MKNILIALMIFISVNVFGQSINEVNKYIYTNERTVNTGKYNFNIETDINYDDTTSITINFEYGDGISQNLYFVSKNDINRLFKDILYLSNITTQKGITLDNSKNYLGIPNKFRSVYLKLFNNKIYLYCFSSSNPFELDKQSAIIFANELIKMKIYIKK